MHQTSGREDPPEASMETLGTGRTHASIRTRTRYRRSSALFLS